MQAYGNEQTMAPGTPLRIDLPILLPNVPDVADACVERLVAALRGQPGVKRVYLYTQDDGTSQLCVHYDPDALNLARIREFVTAAGAQVTERFGHGLWEVEGITHQRRAQTIADQLRALIGVLEADVSAVGRIRVEYDREQYSEQAILELLKDLGVKPTDIDAPAARAEGAQPHDQEEGHKHRGKHHHGHGGIFGSNSELIFALTSGVLLVLGFAMEKLVFGTPPWLPVTCYISAYFFGCFFTVREALDNLRLKKFEIDTPMLVAAAGVAALGAWAEGALLLFLFSLGHVLEHYAMGRAKRAIEALAELAPKRATVRRDGRTHQVPVEELVIGDAVLVCPNEQLPLGRQLGYTKVLP